jgi:hypothetical protein
VVVRYFSMEAGSGTRISPQLLLHQRRKPVHDPPFLLIAPPPAANHARYFRTALNNIRVVGYALNSFREAYFGPFRRNLLVVDYDDLAQRPILVLRALHEQLGEEPFEYDINTVEQIPEAKMFDDWIGAPGLHDVKPSIVYENRTSILPLDIFNNLPQPFWRVKESRNP